MGEPLPICWLGTRKGLLLSRAIRIPPDDNGRPRGIVIIPNDTDISCWQAKHKRYRYCSERYRYLLRVWLTWSLQLESACSLILQIVFSLHYKKNAVQLSHISSQEVANIVRILGFSFLVHRMMIFSLCNIWWFSAYATFRRNPFQKSITTQWSSAEKHNHLALMLPCSPVTANSRCVSPMLQKHASNGIIFHLHSNGQGWRLTTQGSIWQGSMVK